MTASVYRSDLLLVYLLCTHCLAVLTMWLIPFGLLFSVAVTVMSVISLLCLCRQHQWLPGKNSLTKLHFDKDNICTLEYADGNKKAAYKIKGSVIFSLALVLYLQPVKGRTKSIFIARDALAPEVWRQLRVRLRDPDSWA